MTRITRIFADKDQVKEIACEKYENRRKRLGRSRSSRSAVPDQARIFGTDKDQGKEIGEKRLPTTKHTKFTKAVRKKAIEHGSRGSRGLARIKIRLKKLPAKNTKTAEKDWAAQPGKRDCPRNTRSSRRLSAKKQ
jgi:hypothetical protein